MSILDALDPKYRLILCDIWGVVHDGVTIYPGASERLLQWRGQGRYVVLITNAPRTADAVEKQLAKLGLPRDAYDFVVTSGEAGIEALRALGRPVGFLGWRSDRVILEQRGVRIAHGDDFAELACTGLAEDRPDPSEYRPQLKQWAERNVELHCLNPDLVVIRGGVAEPCAGAIAELYETLGGRVTWYGKPHPATYRYALHHAGNPRPSTVLAVGDGLRTDILGAARMGFDAIFVSGGIHAGEPFPGDFAERHALGGWAPLATVPSLL